MLIVILRCARDDSHLLRVAPTAGAPAGCCALASTAKAVRQRVAKVHRDLAITAILTSGGGRAAHSLRATELDGDALAAGDRAVGGLVGERTRVLVREISEHRDERCVVLEIFPHELVVGVPIRVPRRPRVIPA